MEKPQCMQEFWFNWVEVGRLCFMLNWLGTKVWNEDKRIRVTKFCSFLFRSETNARWSDHKRKSGMFSLQLSKLFWKHVKHLNKKFGHVLNMRKSMIQNKAEEYAKKKL